MKFPDPPGRPNDVRLRAEAAAWLAKLHGPERNRELEDDFRSWVGASADRASAFEQVTEVWDLIGPATAAGLPRLTRTWNAGSADDVSAMPSNRRRPAVAGRRRSPSGPRLAAVLAACASAVAIALLYWLLAPQSYTTAVGEQRIITLADGSRVTLNSNTRMEVSYTKRRRRVVLQRGEAYFEVAKNRARPFAVAAGRDTIVAVGTTFVVRREPLLVTVSLIEGKVTVAETDRGASGSATGPPPPAPGTQSALPAATIRLTESPSAVITLLPGERLKLTNTGVGTVDRPDPETTAAWRRGEVVLDDTPLAAAAAEMNRYERRPIVVDDASVAQLSVSGIFRIGEGPDFAKAMATIYGLQVVDTGDAIHLRRARSGSGNR